MKKLLLLIPLLLLVSCGSNLHYHECKIEAVNECWKNNVYNTYSNGLTWDCTYTCVDYSKYIK